MLNQFELIKKGVIGFNFEVRLEWERRRDLNR